MENLKDDQLRSLLVQITNEFYGEKLKSLIFLVSDIVPPCKDDDDAHTVFERLLDTKKLTYKNIDLLYDIIVVTGLICLQETITEFLPDCPNLEDWHPTGALSQYRIMLYKVAECMSNKEIKDIIFSYKVKQVSNDVWSTFLYLDRNLKIENTYDKLNRLKRNVRPKTGKLIDEYLTTGARLTEERKNHRPQVQNQQIGVHDEKDSAAVANLYTGTQTISDTRPVSITKQTGSAKHYMQITKSNTRTFLSPRRKRKYKNVMHYKFDANPRFSHDLQRRHSIVEERQSRRQQVQNLQHIDSNGNINCESGATGAEAKESEGEAEERIAEIDDEQELGDDTGKILIMMFIVCAVVIHLNPSILREEDKGIILLMRHIIMLMLAAKLAVKFILSVLMLAVKLILSIPLSFVQYVVIAILMFIIYIVFSNYAVIQTYFQSCSDEQKTLFVISTIAFVLIILFGVYHFATIKSNFTVILSYLKSLPNIQKAAGFFLIIIFVLMIFGIIPATAPLFKFIWELWSLFF